MSWRNLTQAELAERMNKAGAGTETGTGGRTSWYGKTVSNILSGSRRIDVDELYLLAIALETTVGALLAPEIENQSDVPTFPHPKYQIGAMKPLQRESFRTLVQIPEPHEKRPNVGVLSWAPTYLMEGTPQWKSPTTQVFMEPITEALESSGWPHIDAFVNAHPDALERPFAELADSIRSNPNPDGAEQ